MSDRFGRYMTAVGALQSAAHAVFWGHVQEYRAR